MPEPAVREFTVPDLGEGLEEATIVVWFVAEGDRVILNQPLCELETAKAVVAIPSPFAGVIIERRGEPGETLAVGSLLVRIDTAGDVVADVAGDVAATRREPVLVGYGADETADRSRRRSAGPRAAPAAARGGRPLAKPPVRKLARSLGVDLSALAPGSGADGIVTRGDVMAAAAKTGGGAAGVPTAGDEVVPVRGVRARIAERMSLSRSRIPDATCAVELDFSRLLDVRRQLNEAAERAGHEPVITPLVVVCRLLVEALRAHRIFNATFVEDGPEIHIHERVHLGIGTATDRGLLVPVVRNADQLSTLQLGTRMSELAAGARAATLAPADLSGSTFTVSNFGALGLDDGVPVINHPEAAILGIGAVKPRPIAVDGAVVARPTARLTLAFDHRVCDGAEAGAFLSALRELVEYPEIALLHA